ncbi:unnamed protein product [Prunus armeniaca]|uniref:1-acylglycerol-3-phosphate O-acyltransferase n=1 Tax=Prunus armeniaca TaxID=36596 RepID=A0A6J5YAL4_PRUAR|nr:unnamed protein product [Prunus armeniaca]
MEVQKPSNDAMKHLPLTPLRAIRGVVCLLVLVSTAFMITEVDWMYLWDLALRKGRQGYIKYILKSSLMKLPLFGWSFHILEFISVERKWEVDELNMRRMLSSLKDPQDSLWLALFPEGTDFTEQKCIRSQKYAAENGLPVLKHVLLPKTKGFSACLEELRGSLDAVYDVTIGYKPSCPTFFDNASGVNPSEVHMHVQRIPLDNIPTSEDEVTTWLMNRFHLKDQLLSDFDSEGHFPHEGSEGDLSTLRCLVNLVAVIVLTGTCAYLTIFSSIWFKIYVSSDTMSQHEIDDIERAMRLSLLDLCGKGKNKNENEPSYDEDRDLAEAIKASLRSPGASSSSRQKQRVCDVCDAIIKSTHPPDQIPVCSEIWNQKVCPAHLRDGTPNCCSCRRLKTKYVTYINLGDGRLICDACYSTAIFTTQQCEPLVDICLEFFNNGLQIQIGKHDFHVSMVDEFEMARLSGRGGAGLQTLIDHPPHPDSLVFGKTMSYGPPLISVTSFSRRGNSIITAKQQHLTYGSPLRIAIAFGLPKVMTGAILAHEMMHAWFRLRGIRTGQLELKVEEGMCQVIGRKWLEWLESLEAQDRKTSSAITEHAQFQRNLIETYKYVVDMHSSYEYGHGFREAKWAVEKYKLHRTIDHILTYRKLPG